MNAIRNSLVALMLTAAMPAIAQDVTSTSGSGAEANAGSISGSEANGNQQGQSQNNIGGNNAGIGTSRSASESESNSASFSGSVSDQSQGQSLDNRVNTSTAQTQGQTASNQQGVATNITFNSTNHKRSYVGTNTPVMLAASSSFSSDYCGGTVSGGASVAPIGVSIGGAGTKFDNSCRYLRLAEKAGMTAANYYNMQQPEMAMKAMSMMTWSMCMAGPHQDKMDENLAMQACVALGLLGSGSSPATPPQAYVAPQEVTPMHTQKDNLDPNQYENLPPKTPRGEAPSQKVTPPMAYTTAP